MRWLGNIRLQVILFWTPIFLALMGCVSNPLIKTPVTPPLPSTLTETSLNDLSVLTWVGGLCILFGVIAMVIPFLSSFKGGTAVMIGVMLILLNIALKEYLDWIYVPIIIGAAAVTSTYAYKTVRHLLRKKKCQHSSEQYGSLLWWQPPGSQQVYGSAPRSANSSEEDVVRSLEHPKEDNDATESRGSAAP